MTSARPGPPTMPRRHTFSSFRAFSIDPSSSEPLHRQLYNELRTAILVGRLPSGSRLPASRELAQVTGLSRNTVLSAYDQLIAEGYIESRPGSGTYVASSLPDEVLSGPAMEPAPPADRGSRQLSRRGERLLHTPFRKWPPLQGGPMLFRPGLPGLDEFPLDAWRRLTEKHMRSASAQTLPYGAPPGFLPLRAAMRSNLQHRAGVA